MTNNSAAITVPVTSHDKKALFANEPVQMAEAGSNGLKANIYQIFYSAQTRTGLDSGFTPLDNTGQRPDWYEYWPIRTFLQGQPLQENEFYAFLSPQFKRKTGLDSAQIQAFLDQLDPTVDVITLSPFFDAGALFDNVFKQGARHHPNIWPIFVECAALTAPGVSLDTLLMDSGDTVFCNYFLAKPRFWRHWLERAERIFVLAERNETELARMLNALTRHHNADTTPVKVFFIERLASLLLATEPQWRVRSINAMPLPFAYPAAAKVKPWLAILDSLKMAAKRTGNPEYLQVYANIREQVIRQLDNAG